MGNLTLLEIIFLFVIVLGYAIYNMVSIRAMEKADENEEQENEEQENEENNKKKRGKDNE